MRGPAVEKASGVAGRGGLHSARRWAPTLLVMGPVFVDAGPRFGPYRSPVFPVAGPKAVCFGPKICSTTGKAQKVSAGFGGMDE